MDIFTVLLPTAPKIRFENNAIFFKKILKHKIPHTDYVRNSSSNYFGKSFSYVLNDQCCAYDFRS